jgi:hypothetical protein
MSVPSASKRTGGAGPSVLLNAGLVAAALAAGTWLLVARRQLEWPPHELLRSLVTVAGCLGLVGPLVLARRSGDAGLGELLWFSGGNLLWIQNLALLATGRFHPANAPIAVPAQLLAFAIAAVLVAGWRLHGPGQGWTWSNVFGWGLGLFWIGAGLVP